jgi:hypothetical protein
VFATVLQGSKVLGCDMCLVAEPWSFGAKETGCESAALDVEPAAFDGPGLPRCAHYVTFFDIEDLMLQDLRV